MLTKDHLKYRIRQSRVKPVLLTGTAEEVALAGRLTTSFRNAVGRPRAELEREIAEESGTLAPAFAKLLWDRAEESEDDPQIKEKRWRAFQIAADLRDGFAGSPEEWRTRIAAELGCDEPSLVGGLYGDLPECRQIAAFRELSGEALVQRYNCAQVQGLLLQARDFELDITGCTLDERRVLFRQLKFHRLLAEVETDPAAKTMVIKLSGPLSLFDNAQSYGMRLAQFFPHILHLSKFKLTANVKVKRKEAVLKLDQKIGMQSHYRRQTAYIPPEVQECLAGYREKYEAKTGVAMEPNVDFVHLGRQSYCFPDFKFELNGQTYFIELFHRWHQHQLLQRLDVATLDDRLILGVATAALRKGQKIEDLTELPCFSFREFPTPGQLKTAVELVQNP